MEQKILLVEDSKEIQILVEALMKPKFNLNICDSAERALIELKKDRYSLILLDIGLPEMDGFNLCAQIKMDPNLMDIPIVFLTGKNQSMDKVLGFSLGAEDYIVKPFDPLEFKARIEAKMKNQFLQKEIQTSIKVGQFKIEHLKQKISINVNGSIQDLPLTSIEYKLLQFLLNHEEQVLSRDQLLDSVWGHGANVTDRAVDTCVYSIRQKLGVHSAFIKTLPRAGYVFSQKKAS